jgi:hypothetical protein
MYDLQNLRENPSLRNSVLTTAIAQRRLARTFQRNCEVGIRIVYSVAEISIGK